MKKDLLSIADLSPEDLWRILDLAAELKRESRDGPPRPLLAGKSLALLFQKPSLRTKVSFEVGIRQLGGEAVALAPDEVQLGQREATQDVARVLSRYCDAIAARVHLHSDAEMLAEYASVPVINALSDLSHPCQALADMLTIVEHKGKVTGLTLAYLGDGNNVAHSLLLAGSLAGLHVNVATPKGYGPRADYCQRARQYAKRSGSRVSIGHDPFAAVEGADIIYTDVWVSMGQEDERAARLEAFVPYQVNASLVARAASDAIVMHCLPAHRGEEITDDAIESDRSVVFDQAENRLHAQKAVLVFLMTEGTSVGP